MGYTEFYCTNGGSNLNSGSTTAAPAYTSASGNWVNSTGVFTVTDGTNPSLSVNVGDFAAVYLNSSTNTGYVGRVTAVQNAINGTITVPSTNAWGTKPANQTGTAKITVGGPQKGPNGAAKGFFDGASFASMTNTSGDPPRVNLKNDQTYTMTVGISALGGGSSTIQGYSSSPGDGGRATFSFGTTTGNLISMGGNCTLSDVIITSSASSGTGHGILGAGSDAFIRVTVTGARGSGFQGSTANYFLECEANNCNKSNTAGDAGFVLTSQCVAYRNLASGNTGSNTDGFSASNTAGGIVLCQNVSFGSGRHGFFLPGSIASGNIAIIANNDSYGNGGDGFHFQGTSTNSYYLFENNNAVKNTHYGINSDLTTGRLFGWIYNTGFGAGTEANGDGDTNNLGNLIVSGSVTYASNVNPYNDAANGDFSIVLATAEGAGRGAFTETQGGYSGTVGYPDIGAAQAQVTASTTYRKSSHVFCG